EKLAYRPFSIDRHREYVSQQLRFGKCSALGLYLQLLDARLDQMGCVFTVHDREIPLITDAIRMQPQDPIPDRMKSSAPQCWQLLAEQVSHSPHHLLGRFVREREEEN